MNDYELTGYQGGYATRVSPDGCFAQVLRFTDNGHAHEVLKVFKGETAHTDAEREVMDYVLKLVHG